MLRKAGTASEFDSGDFAHECDDKSKDVAWTQRQLLRCRRFFKSPAGFVASLFLLAVISFSGVALFCTMLPMLWTRRSPAMAPSHDAFLGHRQVLHDEIASMSSNEESSTGGDSVKVDQTWDAGQASKREEVTQEKTPGASAVNTSGDRVRGIHPSMQDKYRSLMLGTGGFPCLDGSLAGHKAAAVVNDDFCECADGTDEPGTGACAGQTKQLPGNSGFFCSWAIAESQHNAPHEIVRHSVVNDGICDCCGGEDEFDSETKCPNACGTLLAEEQAQASKALLGARARKPYVEEGTALQGTLPYSKRDGGPDGTFHALAKHGCLTSKESNTMSFELCLYEQVKQLDNGKTFIIGKNGEWSKSLWEDGTHRKDYSRFIMDGGEYCHASQAPRRAEVIFECAEKDELVSVRESQICVYELLVRTPAACAAEHHEHD